MASAMMNPEGQRGKKSPETGQLAKQRISETRAVLRLAKKYEADKIPQAVMETFPEIVRSLSRKFAELAEVL